ncbi:hypothetical protein UFOVP706_41 [uncultured Caudovirales phage]|uniref:Uncharacterized protein n=1 Tax=uncultured Caudovirales phage TaxID=2100421 RepID=A0A6J5NP57_9CAUD|nr:hypothetical protein UFOVP706_41 [uncultured Caudovirales phage]
MEALQEVLLPDLDEVVADSVVLAKRYGRPCTTAEWADWYGVPAASIGKVLSRAAAQGKIFRLDDLVICGRRFGRAFGAKHLSLRERASRCVLAWLREQSDADGVVACTMQAIADGVDELDLDTAMVATAITRLTKSGVVKTRAVGIYEVKKCSTV